MAWDECDAMSRARRRGGKASSDRRQYHIIFVFGRLKVERPVVLLVVRCHGQLFGRPYALVIFRRHSVIIVGCDEIGSHVSVLILGRLKRFRSNAGEPKMSGAGVLSAPARKRRPP